MESDGYYTMFEVDENTCIYARLHLDQREQDIFAGSRKQIRNDLIGILVGEQNIRDGGFVLVIQDMEGYAERVGLFGFHECLTLVHNKLYNQWDYFTFLYPQTLQTVFKDLPKTERTIRLG